MLPAPEGRLGDVVADAAVNGQPNANLAPEPVSEWWRDSVPWPSWVGRIGWLSARLNHHLRNECQDYQTTFEQRLGATAGPAVVATVRTDTVKMTRWGASREVVSECVQQIYWNMRSVLGGVVAVAVPGLVLSRSPLSLRLALIVSALLVVWGLVEGLEEKTLPGSSDWILGFGALILGGFTLFMVLRFPVTTLRPVTALVSLICAYGIALLVMRTADRIVGRLVRPLTSAMTFAIAAIGVYVAWQYLDLVSRSSWLGFGIALGVTIGGSMALVFVTLQFGLTIYYRTHDLRKFRRAPEAEFVQSTLWAMARANADPGSTVRSEVVGDLEYLARLLEYAVCGVLGREDPESRRTTVKELGGRAAALRDHKRAVLIGRPDAHAKALAMLDGAVVAAARRDWSALPTCDVGDQPEPEGRLVRLTRIATRLTILVVPVAALAVVWLLAGDQLSSWLPAVLPVVITWFAGNLASLVTTPGRDPKSARKSGGRSSR